jgi:peroxiredoxin
MRIHCAVLFFVFMTGLAYGQVIKKQAPQTTDTTSPGKEVKAADRLSELVGLTNQKAPSFISTDMGGTEYSLESLRGKVVVMNLWATFCPPCIGEMPKLNELVDKFKGRDVVFLAPTPDERVLLEGFLRAHPFKYQVLPGSFPIIKKYAPKKKIDSPTDKPDGFSMILPAHLVINQEGTVVKHLLGYKAGTTDELSQTIEQLLRKTP